MDNIIASWTCLVKAKERWNATGVFIEKGANYQFHILSVNEWKDRNTLCGPEGYASPNLLLRLSEQFRRIPQEKWFALIGTIGRSTTNSFTIGSGLDSFTAPADGELFCFANDICFMYFNNTGSIDLKVVKPR